MQNHFDSEIKYLEKELRWVKTAAVKSGAVVTSQVQSVAYSIPLTLVSPTNANGHQIYKLKVNENAIFVPSLDIYYDDIANARGDTRRRAILCYWLEENTYIIWVGAWGNASDRQTLQDGGSVTITGTLKLTCTDAFELEAL